ncbi:MAG: 1-acyl-sn-glycerol-3-phosphate acyltransferase [Nannocystis sp.]|nr:lysophospholipid acyltransferase family protein [Nannocystis sp.]MBA3546556.1 1-acyl-sn-glycerol-3-phosphate acyltransferase [Nannocystis sp.]
MPKLLRILLTGSAFLGFFLFAGLLGRLMLPLVVALPGSPERKRARREWFFLWTNRVFCVYMGMLRLVLYRRPPLPADLPPSGQGYIVIANHPSLVDVLLLGATLPGLTSLAKASWYRSWVLGPLLRHGKHVRGPEPRALTGAGAIDGEDADAPVLERMVEHLRAGHPLLVFPEGSRSHERTMRRFRRGAIEAAIRAQVPIVPVFISVAPPMLMKHQPWYEVPPRGGRFTLEFFPVIETAGRELDARALNQELKQRYEVRHQQMLRERDALELPRSPPALPSKA